MLSWSFVNGVFVVILLVLFLGITIWAWSPKRKKTYQKMAALPLEEDRSTNSGKVGGSDE